MLYYSTNKTLQTVVSIREERKARYEAIKAEWDNLDSLVRKHWAILYENAWLLTDQTEHLGISIAPIEGDYWAPERIWVRFVAPSESPLVQYKVLHEVELHYHAGVKYIDTVRNYSDYKKYVTPKEVLGVNLNIAKRVLSILGCPKE